eukprot:g3194.t1
MDRAVGNVATAKLRKIFRVKLSTRVVQICVGGDGKLLLVLTYRACELWSLDSARLLARYSLLQGEEGRKRGEKVDTWLTCCCIGSTVAASGQSDGSIRVLDVRRLAPIGRRLTANGDSVSSVRFASTLEVLLYATYSSGAVRTWDWQRAELLAECQCCMPVLSVALSRSRMVAGLADGSLRVWRPMTIDEPEKLLERNLIDSILKIGPAACISISPDGKFLAVAEGGDGAGPGRGIVRVYDFVPVLRDPTSAAAEKLFSQEASLQRKRSASSCLFTLSHEAKVTSMCFNADSSVLICAASTSCSIRLWGLTGETDIRRRWGPGEQIFQIDLPHPVFSVAMSQNGNLICSCAERLLVFSLKVEVLYDSHCSVGHSPAIWPFIPLRGDKHAEEKFRHRFALPRATLEESIQGNVLASSLCLNVLADVAKVNRKVLSQAFSNTFTEADLLRYLAASAHDWGAILREMCNRENAEIIEAISNPMVADRVLDGRGLARPTGPALGKRSQHVAVVEMAGEENKVYAYLKQSKIVIQRKNV